MIDRLTHILTHNLANTAIVPWWRALTFREKLLLGVAGGLIAVLLFVLVVFRPLVEYRETALDRYRASAARLESMQAKAGEARRLLAQPRREESGAAAGSIRSIATASAQQRGIALTRLQPGEAGEITLWIDNAESARLYEWIVDLAEKHGIAVARLSITANEGVPTVRAQMQLMRPQGE